MLARDPPGLLAMCSAAYVGAALVIVPRFSAHRYWDDVVRAKVTIIHVRMRLDRLAPLSALMQHPQPALERPHTCGDG